MIWGNLAVAAVLVFCFYFPPTIIHLYAITLLPNGCRDSTLRGMDGPGA